MAEHPREDPVISNLSSQIPELSIHPGESAWLEQLDITVHDFPYIHPLLRSAFRDWIPAVSALEVGGQLSWLLADWTAEVIHTEDKAILSIWHERISQLMRTCLDSGETTAVKLYVDAAEEQHIIAAGIPVRTKSKAEIFAVLGCIIQGSAEEIAFGERILGMAQQHFTSCFYRRFENTFFKDMIAIQEQAKREAQRRSFLVDVVQRLHDKIDVDAVLHEVLDSIVRVYPNVHLEILMSQDHQGSNSRVKLLQLQADTDPLCVQAFMEGKLLRNSFRAENGQQQLEIAVPLSGKQGVYGVFHLFIPYEHFEEADIQLVEMLADTAGTAFENAKLYEQSNQLIHELRLINELTQRLSQSLQLKEIFKFATDELLHIFGAEYCCISQLDKDKDFFEMVSTNVTFLSKEIFPRDCGVCGLVYATKEPIILSDYHSYGRVYSRLMEETGSSSLIGVPLMIRGEVSGTILLTHTRSNYFSYENYKLLQVLSTHIGLAVANASLHAEVRRMANRDMLTGLFARHYLDDKLLEFQRRDAKGSLIVVDIDKFKQVNDTYGHQIGDTILKQVCNIIQSTVRKIDVCARWGGEELAVYLPGMELEEGYQLAENIRERVAVETTPPVTVSCGVSHWSRKDEKISVESLFYRADMALYRSKNNGRNQTQVGRDNQ
ncbi:sensor domain-containing diguanylate cyclase [Paenibacillus sp. YPG26]|uniref:sensor domain-containing diguanylate cyclase n=1 Tax=Paenibacillus sp. YPG26 TaxID=2878915 RepID=UPI0020409A4E|nr:sensor domain-containing diguanylate cyclase [Paenibacillus sp. YPG26]USB34584.1 sensor domain-containing diguanylate cyclase [Paenibacillus sp. YPG26]